MKIKISYWQRIGKSWNLSDILLNEKDILSIAKRKIKRKITKREIDEAEDFYVDKVIV